VVLRLSVLADGEWDDFRAALPAHLAAIVGFPLGMLAAGAITDGVARVIRVRRSAAGPR
jgi:predicted membrane metal-binding protein